MLQATRTWVSELSPTLFWDTDRAKIDAQEHLKMILERVLERGTWHDWSLVSANVSKAEMQGLLPRLRVPPRELNFMKLILAEDDLQP